MDREVELRNQARVAAMFTILKDLEDVGSSCIAEPDKDRVAEILNMWQSSHSVVLQEGATA